LTRRPCRLHRRRREQALDVLVVAVSIETGGDRFHRHSRHAGPPQGVQQRAGDESLADFGIGAGDEPAAWIVHFRA
jgi:hypothetical protein